MFASTPESNAIGLVAAQKQYRKQLCAETGGSYLSEHAHSALHPCRPEDWTVLAL